MKNILFISLADLKSDNGDGIHSRYLLNYLQKKYAVNSITFTKHQNSGQHHTLKFPSNVIYRHLYWNIMILIMFIKIVSRNRVDLIYFREASIVFMPFILRILYPCKLFLEINGITNYDVGMNKVFTDRLFNTFYNITDRIIASKGYIKYLTTIYSISTEKTIPVTLGYHPYERVPPKEKCRENNRLSNMYKYIIFIGNVSEYQGLQYIIPILPKISIPFRLLIVGNGSFEDQLKKMVTAYNAQKYVIFINKQPKEKLAEILNVSDLALSPFSPNRGLPGTISGLKTFEYMYFKIPILTSIMDDMAETIANHGIGSVIESYNPDEILMIIENLLSESTSMKVNQCYGKYYRKFLREYTWENRFSLIVSEIEQLA
jgi:glycosyltransferase involved in cell wall biosynthesis